MTSATAQARQAAGSPWIEGMGVVGWLAKGVLYVVTAVLALQVAFGNRSDESADQQGALKALADQPFGSVLLGVMAAGLAGYGLWRLLDAALDRSDDAKGSAERIGHGLSGLVHLALAAGAIRLLAGGGGEAGNDQAQTFTAKVLELPAGRWMVGIVGLLVAAVGLNFLKEGWKRTFLDELDLTGAGPGERSWVERTGVAGNVGRGVVFVGIAWFLVQAAVQFDANEAKGLDAALRELAGRAYGQALLDAVALGLAAYGFFAMLSARHRRSPGT